MFYCGITLAFSIQISEILVQEFHFTSALTDKTFRTSTNQISQIERLYNLYRNSCFLILIYLQPSKWRVNVQWKLDNHRKARCLKRTLHRHWNDNGTMQNRFLNLDNFFICLAYDDLMVGISDSTNCFW